MKEGCFSTNIHWYNIQFAIFSLLFTLLNTLMLYTAHYRAKIRKGVTVGQTKSIKSDKLGARPEGAPPCERSEAIIILNHNTLLYPEIYIPLYNMECYYLLIIWSVSILLYNIVVCVLLIIWRYYITLLYGGIYILCVNKKASRDYSTSLKW